MLIAVDGTSLEHLDSGYYQEMAGSFVWQIHKAYVGPKIYLRGPTTLGTQCRPIADVVVQTARDWTGRYPGQPLFMTGYSRGGGICIHAARKLLADGIKIRFLALFDAVDRAKDIDGTVIPKNVEFCCHALRNKNNEVNSRLSFGNCGLSIEPPGNLLPRRFKGTHSALGGQPWSGDHPVKHSDAKTFTVTFTSSKSDDIAASTAVREWMWGKLKEVKML